MAQQGSGIYNTVMSYVPGTEEYRKASAQHSEEHHHKVSGSGPMAGGTDTSGDVTTGSAGQDTTGHSQNKPSDVTDHTGGSAYTGHGVGDSSGHDLGGTKDYGSGITGSDRIVDIGRTTGHGSGYKADPGSTYDSDTTNYGSAGDRVGKDSSRETGGYAPSSLGGVHEVETKTTGKPHTGTDRSREDTTFNPNDYSSNPSTYTSGAGSAGYGVGTKTTGKPNTGTYGTGVDTAGVDTASNPSTYSSGAGTYAGKPTVAYDDDTGTHHSGYNPQTSTATDTNTTEGQDGGVKGAPIEGEGVKGYAIGSQVGSGDTENPARTGDPSGQVAGSHLEYGPKETDTRDYTGRGTVGKSQGTGDSSFANVKTTDGQGNSTHVVTKQSTSHMTSSSVTQL